MTYSNSYWMNNMLSNSMWLYITFNSKCWTSKCTWNFADKHQLAHLNFIINFHIGHSNSGSIHVCLTAVTEALYTDYIPVNNNSFVKDLSVYFLWTCVRIRNWQNWKRRQFYSKFASSYFCLNFHSKTAKIYSQ